MAYPPRVNPIGRPSKGDRGRINCRLAQPVHEEVRRRAAALGIPMSQYMADVLAQHVGRADLVRELTPDQESREGAAPLAM